MSEETQVEQVADFLENITESFDKDITDTDAYIDLYAEVLDQDVREKMILSSLTSIFKKSKCEDNPNLRLVEEVTNLVDHPTALKGSFSADFLVLPEELLNLTMMQHQRYFPMKSLETGKITNSFITISNDSRSSSYTGGRVIVRSKI